MQKDDNIKTIRFPVKTDEKLQYIANKSGLTKLSFFIYMVDYFYKNKKDPRDLNDELLKNAINKKTDNIIAFIKTQENELLIPIKKDAEKLIYGQNNIIDALNKHVLKHNEEQKVRYQTQLNTIGDIAGYLKNISGWQDEKKGLKAKFSNILEYYVRNREQMTVLTKQGEKDELIKHVREHVENL